MIKICMLFICLFLTQVITAQKASDKKMDTTTETKSDTAKQEKHAYDKLITDAKGIITDDGLFKVHKIKDDYYFELSKDVLEKEILVVSRIAGHVKGLNFGGAGMKSREQQVIRWQKQGEKILLRSVSYNNVASEELPVYQSVKNNNFEPVIMAFDIKTPNKDTSAFVIEVGNLFTTDVPMIGALGETERKGFSVKGLDKSRSFINYVKSFPQNTEVRHVLTYNADKLPSGSLNGTLSLEMNQSFILLPENPMQPRMYDARVGYFSVAQTDYGLDEQKAATRRYITRWRLEPKDEAAFARGELVEPIKPIVYYIDPATPEKWRPYIKQGVNDWQKAFEKAGFKNAIMAKDPPSKEEDPDWSPEDARYSVIRYITTDIQNAVGPHVHDPRTGEILESDILWYHNIMNLLRNWFLTQTAAVNPDAQSYTKFKDEVMGRLIRFVAAHEVGHTLGLPHNMGSSVAYPVDSLRSPSFTKQFGTAPSIMDYARFNHVAQPGDGDVALMPNIGPYDEWSIIYGYKPTKATSPEEEHRLYLNSWVKERANNPIYRYGAQRSNPTDPTAQTEDLGDDLVKASDYGIENLKRMMPNLIKWTAEDGKSYEDLNELYGQILGQYNKYMRHVGTIVGGVYEFRKTYDEAGVVFTHVEKNKQQEAVRFLHRQLFQTPSWIINEDIIRRIQSDGVAERLRQLQVGTLNRLFEGDRLNRLMEGEALNGSAAYTMLNLFDDTRIGIFSELKSGSKIDPYRRNLQRAYLDKMLDLLALKDDKYNQTDIKALARGTLNNLKKEIDQAVRKQSDQVTKYHLEDLLMRIEKGLKLEVE